MPDFSHLEAIQDRLARERGRLAGAQTAAERDLRSVWVRQAEQELASERVFLGLPADDDLPTLTDDELLAALGEEG